MVSGVSARTAEIEEIYRAGYRTFFRVVVAIVRDEQLAEEAIHDAFVRALRHRSRFGGRGSLEGWLWRIVVNEARRRRTVEQQRHSRLVVSRSDDAAAAAATNDHRDSGALEVLVA